MRILFLRRHAKSDWNQQTACDIDRPLNRRGQNAAAHIGQWMPTLRGDMHGMRRELVQYLAHLAGGIEGQWIEG